MEPMTILRNISPLSGGTAIFQKMIIGADRATTAASEASPIKCAGGECAGLPALSHTWPCMRKCRLPADSLPAHFIGEASAVAPFKMSL